MNRNRYKYFRAVSRCLVFLMLMPSLITLGFSTTTSFAQRAVRTVALVQVINSSDWLQEDLLATVENCLLFALAEEVSLKPITNSIVERAGEVVKLSEPATLEELVAFGSEIKGVDYVAAGEVVSIVFDSQKGLAQVKLAVRIVSVKWGRESARALVVGSSSERADVKDQAGALVSEGAACAARIAIAELVANLATRGAVIGIDADKGEFVINLGEKDGVRVGAEFSVLRRGQEIARLEVVEVGVLSCETCLIAETLRQSIATGDRVALLYNPSPTLVPLQIVEKEREPWKTVLGVLATLWLIWLISKERAEVQASMGILPPLSRILPADGRSTLEISVRVLDSNNHPVPEGTAVDFILEGLTGQTGMALGCILSPAFTDANGIATTTLTSGTEPGLVRVTARSGGCEDSIEIEYVEPAAFIALTATPDSIPADGVASSVIEATVTDINGNPVSDGIIVSFSTTAGTLSLTEATTQGGVATTILTSGTVIGPATVTATVGQVSASIVVPFTSP